jgi:hypothetical protein
MKDICSSCPAQAVPLRGKSQIQKPENPIQQTERKPLFDLGELATTGGALAALERADSKRWSSSRNITGNWGDIPEEDRKENQFGSESSFRLLGSYRTAAANREWVITEMTRSHTTLSLPDEY